MSEILNRGRKVEVVGKVISDKMDKTISILTFRMIRHKKYGKFVKKSSVLKAHDEKEIAKVGDKVRIIETKPISKSKRWKLTEVIETSKE
jgi:small subunit ribosomal protein S17